MKSTMPVYTLAEVAQHSHTILMGDASYMLRGINTLQQADKEQLTFLSNAKYQKNLATTKAGCVILHSSFEHLFDGNKLVTDDPYYAFALVTKLFAPKKEMKKDVHPSVVLGANVQLANDVDIAPNVVIGNNVIITAGVSIGASCYIGDNTVIADNVHIYPNVSIYGDTSIGKNTIIHSQVVIGADGFGFASKNDGSGHWQKIYQLGGVSIGDDVEIGAGTTIDRGALDNTIIANGVKLDNQIQVAHNVEIGENTAIAGATAIAGSTVIGKRCTIAGAVGIAGHLTIADDVHITAMTLVTKSIATSGSYSSGTPLNSTSEWRKNAARFNRLDDSLRKIALKTKL
ncbi:MAG: UDP-3-O-[3-hydroxymyristoyl] glucosamine N-acyltransferase [Kiritimatiellia bacterium]|jgi:UDP-3-O-[3-hydroxymyristoyl] glucosamine N-acyltransferase